MRRLSDTQEKGILANNKANSLCCWHSTTYLQAKACVLLVHRFCFSCQGYDRVGSLALMLQSPKLSGLNTYHETDVGWCQMFLKAWRVEWSMLFGLTERPQRPWIWSWITGNLLHRSTQGRVKEILLSRVFRNLNACMLAENQWPKPNGFTWFGQLFTVCACQLCSVQAQIQKKSEYW